MPTSLSHAAAGLAIASVLKPAKATSRYWMLAAACAAIPDIDALSLPLRLPPNDLLGHRGITHSVLFAVGLSAVVTALWFPRERVGDDRWRIWLAMCLATMSHGLLDALSSYGHGVALLAPMWNQHLCFSSRPLGNIGVGHRGVLSLSLRVAANEAIWIWMPSALVTSLALLLERHRARSGTVPFLPRVRMLRGIMLRSSVIWAATRAALFIFEVRDLPVPVAVGLVVMTTIVTTLDGRSRDGTAFLGNLGIGEWRLAVVACIPPTIFETIIWTATQLTPLC